MMPMRQFDNRGGNLYNETIIFTNLKIDLKESSRDIC